MSLNGSAIRPADNSIGWISNVVPALGSVRLSVGDVLVTVDGAFPRDVMSVVAPDVETLRTVRGAFQDDGFIDALVAASDGATLPGPELSDDLVRVAVLSAVRQFHLSDLDGIALLIDRAYAGTLADDEVTASMFYRLSSLGAEQIAQDMVENEISGAVVDEFAVQMRVAPDDSLRSDIRSAIFGSIDELEQTANTLWSYSFRETTTSAAVAMAGPVTPLERPASVGVLNDLQTIPPRILTFDGPRLPDVTVTSDDPGFAVVSAQLRDNVDETSAEVAELFAVAADRITGALVGFAACVVSGRTISARIVLQNRTVDTAHFAIVGASVNPDELHLDELGVGLAEVDRYCRHAWTLHRVAAAALANTGVGTTGVQIDANRAQIAETLLRARQSARDADDAVRAILSDYEDHDGLAAYVESVKRLRSLVDSDLVIDGPARPTFAELYALVAE